MGIMSELAQAGIKGLKTGTKNFIESNLGKMDGKSIINMYQTNPAKYTEFISDIDNYVKAPNEDLGYNIIKKADDWTAQRQQGAISDKSMALGYTRPDAIKNLQEAGADRLSNMKRKPRTIQGPVPPQLPDKTFDQGARSYEEAVMLGTTKYVDEDGVAQQIRNYGSPTAPHGRVTKVDVRKMSGRGTEGRIAWEKLLTIDENAKGFYGVKLKGKEHAHHWNPIGVMKRVVEGLDPKVRNQLISEAQEEFGLYSGNVMFNLRQLPTDVHDKLHKALNKAGYDPKTMQSFAEADYATRKAFLKEFSKVLNDLDQQVFEEIMTKTHGSNWISQFTGLQVE